MQKLEELGVTELDAAEMTRVSGGTDRTFHIGGTGGPDDVIQWFVEKLSSPEVQQPTDTPYAPTY
jgi:hypothetical protein